MGTIPGARAMCVNSLLCQVTPNRVCLKKLLSQGASPVLLTKTFGESNMRTTTRELTYVRTYVCMQCTVCVFS